MIMNTQPPSFYQRVVDKTKGLAFQSQFIAQNIDKKKVSITAGNPGMVCVALINHLVMLVSPNSGFVFIV